MNLRKRTCQDGKENVSEPPATAAMAPFMNLETYKSKPHYSKRQRVSESPKASTSAMESPKKRRKYNSKVHCPKCKRFLSQRSLRRHVERFHGGMLDSMTRGNITCLECTQKFTSERRLVAHLKHCCGMEFPEEDLYFNDYKEFHAWKDRIERNTKSQYYQYSGTSYSTNGRSSRYSCNRTGYYKSRAKTSRGKSSGSVKTIKMGRHCTSNIRVFEKNGTLHVTYIATHYGHDEETSKKKKTPRTRSTTRKTSLTSSQKPHTQKTNERVSSKSIPRLAAQDRIVSTLQDLIKNVNNTSSLDVLESFEKVVMGAQLSFDILLSYKNEKGEKGKNINVKETLQNVLNDIQLNEQVMSNI